MSYEEDALLHFISRMRSLNEASFAKYTFDTCDTRTKFIDSNKKIIFSKDVMLEMLDAQLDVFGTNAERGFFIYGKEVAPNMVLFFKTTDNEFYNVTVSRTNLSNKEKYQKSTLMMSEEALYEVLSNALDREIPDHTQAVDSIIHFHTHNDQSINTATYSMKDIYLYSHLLPIVNDDLEIIEETRRIKFYGALMCPDRIKKEIKLSVVEPYRSYDIDEPNIEMYKMPLYQLSMDASRIDRIDPDKLMSYKLMYCDNVDEMAYMSDKCYYNEVTHEESGKKMLNDIKTYVKRTRK